MYFSSFLTTFAESLHINRMKYYLKKDKNVTPERYILNYAKKKKYCVCVCVGGGGGGDKYGPLERQLVW